MNKRKPTCHIIYFVIVNLVFVSYSYSQTTVVEIDKLTNTLKKQIPFDVPFILKVPLESKEQVVDTIYVFQSSLDRKGRRLWSNTLLEANNFEQVGDQLIIRMKAIGPKTNFEVLISNRLHGERLKDLMKINKKIFEGGDAKEMFNDWRSKLDIARDGNNFEEVYNTTFGFDWYRDFWKGYLGFFNKNLRSHYDKIHSQISSIERESLNAESISSISKWGKSFGLTASELGYLNYLFKNDSKSFWDLFVTGYLDFDSMFDLEEIEEFEFDKRSKVLDNNIKSVSNLIVFTERLSLHIDTPISAIVVQDVNKELNKVLAVLITNKEIIKDESKEILDAIAESKNLRYGSSFAVDNLELDLKTETEISIIPDFGVARIVAAGNTERTTFLRPYAGLNFNIRPINKQLKIKELRRYDRDIKNPENKILSIWHQVSFSVGVTIGGLDDDEFEDLYKSLSILTGVNYRPMRGVYVSTGAVWLKQIDTNPIITESKVEPAWYLGLSFDLDIANVFKPVTGLLF